MEVGIEAARWVVGKALGPAGGGVLEAWAASSELGTNISALRMELLYAQGNASGRGREDIQNPALAELLQELRNLAHSADDALDEVDYFRIQDELDSTYHAADEHAGGCVHGLLLNARHTARAVASKLKLSSGSREVRASRGEPSDDHGDDAKQGCLSGICSCGRRAIGSTPNSPSIQSNHNGGGGCMSMVASGACRAAHTVGTRLPCCSFPCVHHSDSSANENGCPSFCCACLSKPHERKCEAPEETPKLKFDRVEISKRMKDIVDKLKPVSAKVSTILDMELLGSAILKLEQLGSGRSTTQSSAMDRRKTTPDVIEPKLYERDNQKTVIVHNIKHGKYFADDLVVLPILGPGGIGKTAFTRDIYNEVEDHFEVRIWLCVSLNFDANRLAQEAVKKIPQVDSENKNGSDQERIEQRLKAKRFLLVLDDMWTCHEDEWKNC